MIFSILSTFYLEYMKSFFPLLFKFLLSLYFFFFFIFALYMFGKEKKRGV